MSIFEWVVLYFCSAFTLHLWEQTIFLIFINPPFLFYFKYLVFIFLCILTVSSRFCDIWTFRLNWTTDCIEIWMRQVMTSPIGQFQTRWSSASMPDVMPGTQTSLRVFQKQPGSAKDSFYFDNNLVWEKFPFYSIESHINASI